MPKTIPTMLIGAVAFALLGDPTFAQQPIDINRPLAADRLGNPSIDVVTSVPLANDFAAWRIALLGRIPLGIEILDGTPVTDQKTRLDLTGSTVQDALNALVALDARYAWTLKGIPTILPRGAEYDVRDPLNQQAVADWRGVTAEQAVMNVVRILKNDIPQPQPPVIHDGRELDIVVRSGTVRDVLNEIARVHGTLMWSAVRSQDGEIRQIAIRWFDGHAYSVSPTREPRSATTSAR